ncbi:MAG: hydroxymethylbilane synthase [Usitatibacter sp.]
MTRTTETVRIATRESRLAMVQTEMVAAALRTRHPGIAVEIVGMTTKGDRILDRPLSQVGGKGLFVKELEVAMDDGRADIAVHSMKDVPMVVPPQFALTTFGERETPLDAFVSTRYASLAELPDGAIVGTSSLRRECQLRHAFPKLQLRALRGNVQTRLAKLDAGDYHAIILAAAGLSRLGLAERIRMLLAESFAIPAICQGILAVEYRRSRDDLAAMLRAFEDAPTAFAAEAERALGLIVEGSCEVPVGGLARVSEGAVSLEGFIGMPDGRRVVRDRLAGPAAEAAAVGARLGAKLLDAGGAEILRELATRAA